MVKINKNKIFKKIKEQFSVEVLEGKNHTLQNL